MSLLTLISPQELISNALHYLKCPQRVLAQELGVHRRSLERWMAKGLTLAEAQEAAKNIAERPHRIPKPHKKENMPVSITPDPNKLTQVLVQGDCVEVMKRLPNESVDLVVTSPPYATQRKATYGGIDPDKYVAWFLPIAAEMQRVLKPTGSFVLNIKENVVDGERSTYVMELIMALRQQGWRYVDDYIWHKRNATPGKWPNRFRDAWEHCLHFTKQKHFSMYQEAVMVPMGDWAQKRLANLSANDRERHVSATESGFGRKIENWVNRKMAYPTNVLHLAAECGNRNHSAVFPKSLPEWFIKLFTAKGDVVLDPFSGSGTTISVAHSLERSSIGIELSEEYAKNTVKELGLVPTTDETVHELKA